MSYDGKQLNKPSKFLISLGFKLILILTGAVTAVSYLKI